MFSALEQACHLRDIEIDAYQVRLRRSVRKVDLPRFGRQLDYATCLSCEALSYSAVRLRRPR
jgi:hypothetical protein